MVAHPRAASRLGAIRALNSPRPLQVRESASGGPALVHLNQRWLRVERLLDSWRIDDEWWSSQPIARLYYRVALAPAGDIVIFRDLLSGAWFRQQV